MNVEPDVTFDARKPPVRFPPRRAVLAAPSRPDHPKADRFFSSGKADRRGAPNDRRSKWLSSFP